MSIPQHCVDDTADVIRALERTVDDALQLYGRLYAELIKAQNEGKLHPMLMHREIFARMPAVGASLMAARGDAVELHKGMNRIASTLGLTKSDASPPEEKTWPPPGWGFPLAIADADAPAAADFPALS